MDTTGAVTANSPTARLLRKSRAFAFLARISHQPFVKDIPQRGKVIIPFATSGGSGIGKTNERLAPSCKGAKLMDGKVFKGSVGHQELAAWVEELGL